MSSHNGSSGGPASELAELIDELAARLQAGEVVDIEAAAREHPSHADELRKLLPALGALDELSRSADSDASGAPSHGFELPSGVLGDFRILREVGRGGMGIVYEAEQISLGRRVALKVLPFAGTMDSRQLQRFKNEAHAAAQLHHTNVVPVYAVGAERGVHFYAMQYIEGRSLAEVINDLRRQTRPEPAKDAVPIPNRPIEESGRGAPTGSDNPPAEATTAYTPPPAGRASVSTKPIAALSTIRSTKDATYFRAVAELGIQAAEALDFAHERGVIHRDIKPANLLVDADARLWVTDFGLAQVQSNTRITMTGDLVGTLRYMSPEQALAKRVVVDHRTDVYSLGATLYEVLTQQPAYGAVDRQELLRQIAFEEPRSPRRISKAIPAELETIVLKAMEKNPVDRYATAQELADDLRRFVADEPIRARRPSWALQARKWLRRHPAVPRAAVGMLLLTVVGLALGAYLVWQEKTKKEAALDLAEDQKKQAIEFRDRALAALRDMTDDVIEKQMARGTTLTEENKEFLRKIIKHFEGFAAITADDANSRGIRAEGYLRVGSMRHSLGELAEAETAYRDALALLKQLAGDFPSRPEFRKDLAGSHNNLGALLSDTGRLAEAETAYRDALALQKQLAADLPTRPEFRRNLAACHGNLGALLKDTGRLAEAETAYRDALALLKQLAADFPSRPEFRQELATSHGNLGALLWDTGRPAEAETAFRDGLALLKQLAADFPSRPEFRRNLAGSHYNLGVLLYRTGRLAEAETAYRDALALLKQLAADFPSRPEFRQELAACHGNLGALLKDTGRLAEAEMAYCDALALDKQLAADFPNRPEFRHELAADHNNLGLLLAQTGRPTKADTAYRDALALSKQLADDFPNRPVFGYLLAISHYNLGKLFHDTGRLAEAEMAYRHALTPFRQPAAEFSNQPEVREQLARTLVNLALLCNQRLDFPATKAYLDEARPHHQAALKANPRHPDYRLHFQIHLLALVQAHAGLLDQPAAVQAAEEFRDLGWDPPNDAYNAACALALCIPIVASHPKHEVGNEADLDKAKRQAAVQSYGDAAMKMLQTAVTKGFKDAAHMKKDTDLDPVRAREDFQRLLRELEGTASATPELVPPPKEVQSK